METLDSFALKVIFGMYRVQRPKDNSFSTRKFSPVDMHQQQLLQAKGRN